MLHVDTEFLFHGALSVWINMGGGTEAIIKCICIEKAKSTLTQYVLRNQPGKNYRQMRLTRYLENVCLVRHSLKVICNGKTSRTICHALHYVTCMLHLGMCDGPVLYLLLTSFMEGSMTVFWHLIDLWCIQCAAIFGKWYWFIQICVYEIHYILVETLLLVSKVSFNKAYLLT